MTTTADGLESPSIDVADWPDVAGTADDVPRFNRESLRFEIDTEGKANWAAGLILGAREELARIKAGAKAATEDRKRRVEDLEARFIEPLREWAAANLPYNKKSIVTLAGTFKLTARGESMTIEDADAALRWASGGIGGDEFAQCPEAVRDVASVPAAFMAEAIEVLREHAPHLVIETRELRDGAAVTLLAHYKATGEIPPGCRYVEAHDAFTLAAPKP